MEGARQFQDRILRDTGRRVGWAYAGRVRRSGDHSQVLLDASGFRVRGATCHYGRGSRPRRTRGNCLARWTETEVTVAIAFGFGQIERSGTSVTNQVAIDPFVPGLPGDHVQRTQLGDRQHVAKVIGHELPPLVHPVTPPSTAWAPPWCPTRILVSPMSPDKIVTD